MSLAAEDSILAYESVDNSRRVDLSDVSASAGEIKQLLKVDSEFFLEFFIPEEMTSEMPQFHGEIWDRLCDQTKERILLAIPRGHNKTTLAKLNVVWHWLYTSHRFCVYLSNTNAIALNACKDIMAYLQSPNFIKVFGQIRITKKSETDSLWIFDLPLGNGQWKTCILRAVGAGQQVRGLNIENQRPDIAVIDDVEDLENTGSELLQKKLDLWMFGPFLKALGRRDRKVIWLGNMLTKTSLLARLSRNPDWNPVVFGAMIKDAITGVLKPLWPAIWTIEALIKDFKEHKDLGLVESWMCEMMNMPGHGENGFTEEQINYEVVPTPDQIRAAFITIDPAFGENAHNDNTAIVVHAIPNDGPPMVVAHINSKMDEASILENTLALAQYWNAWTWGIESVAAQKVLITLFKVILAGKMITHVELVPLMAGKGDPKVGRIRAWVALMAKKEYAIPEYDVEITTQLLGYNMKKTSNTDDLIDSCAYGPQMLDLYLPLILAQSSGADLDAQTLIQYGTEVAGV